MRLFCIDSSGPALSLACLEKDQAVAMWEGELPGRRSEQILPKAQSLMEKLQWAPSSLEAVAVSRGPGSFTGLRVGLAFAKGLALDGVRTMSESTLKVWAQAVLPALQALGQDEIAVLLDARRGQVYRGHFRHSLGGWEELAPPEMMDLSLAQKGIENAALCGDLNTAPWNSPWLMRERPLAEGLGELIVARLKKNALDFEESALMQPDYLRRPEVEILWEKRQAAKKV